MTQAWLTGPNAYAGGFNSTTTSDLCGSSAHQMTLPNFSDQILLPVGEASLTDAMLTPLIGDPSVRVGVMKIVDDVDCRELTP